MAGSGDFVEIYSAAGTAEADVVKSLLDSRKIPVRVQAESIGRISGLTSGPLSEVRLLVPADRAADARKLIDRRPAGARVKPQRMSGTMRLLAWTLLVILVALLVLLYVTRFP